MPNAVVKTMTKYYVGIDLGGTNLKLGLVSADGRILDRLTTPTEDAPGPDHVLECMARAVHDLAERAGIEAGDVAAVGVGAPGPVDWKAGVVLFAPNLKGWINIPVRDVLHEKLGVMVNLENDANVAAYGEFRCGAARGADTMFLLTLGTGIGGGIIIDGRLFRGATDTGAELGHIVIQHGGRTCGCGRKGCLEAYASATAVVGRFKDAEAAGEPSSLADNDEVTCEDIFVAAAEGDDLAARIAEETAEYLAIGITSIMHVLNPEMVVLTGGMMGAGDAFLARVRHHVRETVFERAWSGCEIRWSTLGGDAGILGAALAAEAFDRTGRPA